MYEYWIDYRDRDHKRKEMIFYLPTKHKQKKVMKMFRKKMYDPGHKIEVFRLTCD
jgi:hypothetical protein